MDNAKAAMNQDEHSKKQEKLMKRYENVKIKIDKFEKMKLEKVCRAVKIRRYIDELKDMDGVLEEFDKRVFELLLDKILIKNSGTEHCTCISNIII